MKKKPALIEKPPSRAVNITSARMTTRQKPVIAFPTPPEEPATITAIIGGKRYRFPFTISVGAIEKLEPVAPVMPIHRKGRHEKKARGRNKTRHDDGHAVKGFALCFRLNR